MRHFRHIIKFINTTIIFIPLNFFISIVVPLHPYVMLPNHTKPLFQYLKYHSNQSLAPLSILNSTLAFKVSTPEVIDPIMHIFIRNSFLCNILNRLWFKFLVLASAIINFPLVKLNRAYIYVLQQELKGRISKLEN